jgi:peptidoglycan-associated lipoprotein
MNNLKKTLCTAAAVLVLPLAGCAHSNQTIAKTPDATSTTTITSGTVQPTTPVSTSISVSDELMQKCNLVMNDPSAAPKFDFDQSALLSDDDAILQQIATCVTTGPLKGAELQLVGRADPRGTEQYNMVLGASRAAAVGTYLGQLGVDDLRETSRGSLDATGQDNAGWAMDRRVDIELAR